MTRTRENEFETDECDDEVGDEDSACLLCTEVVWHNKPGEKGRKGEREKDMLTFFIQRTLNFKLHKNFISKNFSLKYNVFLKNFPWL